MTEYQEWLDVPRDDKIDERLRQHLLGMYRQGDDPLHPNHHLRDCPGTTITTFDSRRSDYGNVRFDVTLACPHETDQWVLEVPGVFIRRNNVEAQAGQ